MNIKMLAIGDSITFGLCASRPENRWVDRLGAQLGAWLGTPVEVCNRGISGNILCIQTPAYEYAIKPVGLERLERDVIAEKPQLLLIAYGLNDSRGGTSLAQFRRDYQQMLARIRQQIHPVIVALDLFYMHESFYKDCENWACSDYALAAEFNQAIRQLAQENHLIFADVFQAMFGRDELVSDDHCHPNDLGHQVIADTVFRAIQAANPTFHEP